MHISADNVVHFSAMKYSIFHLSAVHCILLQCSAVQCSAVQCSALLQVTECQEEGCQAVTCYNQVINMYDCTLLYLLLQTVFYCIALYLFVFHCSSLYCTAISYTAVKGHILKYIAINFPSPNSITQITALHSTSQK